jgi:hypothetical protein
MPLNGIENQTNCGARIGRYTAGLTNATRAASSNRHGRAEVRPGDAGIDEQSIAWLAQDFQQQPPFMSGGPPHSEELYHAMSDVVHLALLDQDTGFATA